MRIISGTHRGKKLTAPKNIDVRPTTDFAKTGLFNILNNRIDFDGLKVLDLYAGIGSISFEFISRGCEHVTSVEINKACTKFMINTAADMRMDNISVLTMDAFSFLEICRESYDVIFADPPYDDAGTNDLLPQIIERKLLNPEGIFILEHRSRYIPADTDLFNERRKYGEVAFSFYTNNSPE